MNNISITLSSFDIVVRAGPNGFFNGKEEEFRYIKSPLLSWAKTINDSEYNNFCKNALDMAEELVRQTNKNLTLTYFVKIDK